MTGSEKSGRSRLSACRTKPTQAKPTTTLFGSSLEKVDPERLKLAESMDLDAIEEASKPKMQVRNPPPVLAAEIKDPSRLNAVRDKLEISKRDLKQADRNLQQMEEHVLYNPGEYESDIPSPTSLPIPDKPHQWMTSSDLANASTINVLGVNPNRNESYNRDRYEQRPPVHEYSMLGDPMNRGAKRDPTRKDYAKRNKASQIDDMQKELDRKMYISNYSTDFSRKERVTHSDLPIELPKNIEHEFGSRLCRELFAKPGTITVLEEQAKQRAHQRREKTPLKTPKLEEATWYEGLANALRYDHFPGYSGNYTSTSTKDDFNDDVHANRVPVPDQYRYKRDDLSNWAESNVLRDRMKKAWDAHREELKASKA